MESPVAGADVQNLVTDRTPLILTVSLRFPLMSLKGARKGL